MYLQIITAIKNTYALRLKHLTVNLSPLPILLKMHDLIYKYKIYPANEYNIIYFDLSESGAFGGHIGLIKRARVISRMDFPLFTECMHIRGLDRRDFFPSTRICNKSFRGYGVDGAPVDTKPTPSL